MMNHKDQEESKKRVGCAAADLVQNGMLVGLGTGSTVFHFIHRLTERIKEGLTIAVASSSIASENQAKKGRIPLANMDTLIALDLMVDGADEINKKKEMIKGGGGALLREKILATISKKMVVIVDESKVVEKLGAHPLPVEILPFAQHAIIEKIRSCGFEGTLRTIDNQKKLFKTDNGNLIYDICFNCLREDPQKDHATLISIPGVVETGFFFNPVQQVLIGKKNGSLQRWS